MSPSRRRVGVVLVVDPPVGSWVDGLRRGVGDAAIDRISPHITLVPPLNLRAGDLDAALDRLHDAAASVAGPLRLTLGPVGSFLPHNPVLLLEVGGDLPGLRTVRDAAFRAPLERPLTWPWVPHVTLADAVDPARAELAARCLDRFAAVTDVGRITLLEERHGPPGRRWVPLADAALGPAAVVGRGGLELRLVTGRTPEPTAAELLGGGPGGTPGGPCGEPGADRLVVTGRRGGATVGAASAWRDDDGGHIRVVVAPDHRRGGIGSHLLAAAEEAARREAWGCSRLAAEGPSGFYAARSSWSVAP